MKPLGGWRDQRTGRVFGFQSEAQRENFMICSRAVQQRAEPSDAALHGRPTAWASRARRRGCAAGQPASATAGVLLKRARLTAAHLSGDLDRIQRARDALGPQPAARALAARSARARQDDHAGRRR